MFLGKVSFFTKSIKSIAYGNPHVETNKMRHDSIFYVNYIKSYDSLKRWKLITKQVFVSCHFISRNQLSSNFFQKPHEWSEQNLLNKLADMFKFKNIYAYSVTTRADFSENSLKEKKNDPIPFIKFPFLSIMCPRNVPYFL